ncbi:serine/threonine protein phosphatase [candidate division KSB3 bacterium]|uniref:Serine/threonine protein phosphatase n=1 Tax=candidate division KSB3 bacterium TaxID=2044937 RepID=A0A2G6E3Y3_9BACT|nr:MAG: serine/threonine protein phosphatase [candidate division KSB3 bacterium]PIE29124.1 MAG: serine/threonine protein phosphatase [candidate division KSB3 bacterium]
MSTEHFMIYRVSSGTDPGLRKTLNEDSFWLCSDKQIDPEVLDGLGSVYAVADGVSGKEGGELASGIAINTFGMYYVLPHVAIPPEDRLRNVFLEAHRRIEEYAELHPHYRGMGTTLTAAVLKGNMLYYGHVGDSRLYLIRSGSRSIQQLSKDHTLVNKFIEEGKLTTEEAAQEDSNVLSQALGAVPKIHVETGEYGPLEAGDLLLLCSDGLSDLVADAKIRDIILGSPGLDDACRRLIAKANQNGGQDNITVVLIAAETKTQGEKV